MVRYGAQSPEIYTLYDCNYRTLFIRVTAGSDESAAVCVCVTSYFPYPSHTHKHTLICFQKKALCLVSGKIKESEQFPESELILF